MAIRKKQKLIVLENKELIEAIAGEEAEFEGVNGSNVLEKYLLKGMITPNESIAQTLSQLYTDQISYQLCIETIWSIIADDPVGNIQRQGNIEVVHACRNQALHAKLKIADTDWEKYPYRPDYLITCIENIIELLSDDLNAGDFKFMYEEFSLPYHIEFARELVEQYRHNLTGICLNDFYQLIIDTWLHLFAFRGTYKLLCELATIQKRGVDVGSDRYHYRKALIKASKDWL